MCFSLENSGQNFLSDILGFYYLNAFASLRAVKSIEIPHARRQSK